MPEIPKKWHAIWLGSDLPDKYKENIRSWMLHNPNFEFNLYIDSGCLSPNPKFDNDPNCFEQAIPAIQAFCDNPFADQSDRKIILHDIGTIPECAQFVAEPFYNDWVTGLDKTYAFAADILRLCVLYVFGGLYTDIDCQCKSKVILPENSTGLYVCGGDDENGKPIFYDNWLIASTAKNPIFIECLTKMHDNYNARIFGEYGSQDFCGGKPVISDGARRAELFAKPILFSVDLEQYAKDQDLKTAKFAELEKEYKFNRQVYSDIRKKSSDNLQKKSQSFGAAVALKVLYARTLLEFGAEGIRQSIYPFDESLEHKYAASWHEFEYAKTEIDPDEYAFARSIFTKFRI